MITSIISYLYILSIDVYLKRLNIKHTLYPYTHTQCTHNVIMNIIPYKYTYIHVHHDIEVVLEDESRASHRNGPAFDYANEINLMVRHDVHVQWRKQLEQIFIVLMPIFPNWMLDARCLDARLKWKIIL